MSLFSFFVSIFKYLEFRQIFHLITDGVPFVPLKHLSKSQGLSANLKYSTVQVKAD